MDIDFATLFFNALVQSIGILANAFGEAFTQNPWPFLGIGGLIVLGFFVPKKLVRRRRRA